MRRLPFHLDVPILQAPMAGVQGSALAIAVSDAGGLGALPCAMLDAATTRAEIQAIKAATGRPFNANFFCHTPVPPDPVREAAWRARMRPYYDELGLDPDAIPEAPRREPFGPEAAAIVADARVPVVSFHFGLPAEPLLAPLRAAGCRILASATTVDEARWLVARGVDAIVAQGLEAGGHRGMFLSLDLGTQRGTLELVSAILEAVDVPVIAAGGLSSPDRVAAALALGASAVQAGTAYLRCPEATTRPVHRAALASDAALSTAVTNLFTGRPARGIVNRVMDELGPLDPTVPPFPWAATALGPLRARAEALGSGDFSPLWAGVGGAECRELGAADITRWLASGC
jgi:nitronate monooxygenase